MQWLNVVLTGEHTTSQSLNVDVDPLHYSAVTAFVLRTDGLFQSTVDKDKEEELGLHPNQEIRRKIHSSIFHQ